jgi:hypothetical protein
MTRDETTTPLLAAVIAGDGDRVAALLREGADPNQRAGDGLPPLVLAAKIHVPALYDLGADVSARAEPAEPCIRHLVAAGADLMRQGPEAAFRAVSNRAVSTLRALDEAGLDWHAVYAEGDEPGRLIDLLLAQATASGGLADGVVEFCLQHGAHREHRSAGKSPLLALVGKVNLDLPALKRLVAAGADLEATDVRGLTPLMLAAALGHGDAFKLLVGQGADPWRQDPAGRCALHWAAAFGQRDVLQLAELLGLRTHPMPTAAVDREPCPLDAVAPRGCFALGRHPGAGVFAALATGADLAEVHAQLHAAYGNYRSPQGPFLVARLEAAARVPLGATHPFASSVAFAATPGTHLLLELLGVQPVQSMADRDPPDAFPARALLTVAAAGEPSLEAQRSLSTRSYVAVLETILTLEDGYPDEHASVRWDGEALRT